MTKFDIFHVFVENSVNSEFCFFWALLKPAKNLKFIKKYPSLSSLKNKFQWTQKIFEPLMRNILIWTF